LELDQDGTAAKRKKTTQEISDQKHDTSALSIPPITQVSKDSIMETPPITQASKDSDTIMETATTATTTTAASPPPTNHDSSSTILSTPINTPSQPPTLASSPTTTTTLDNQSTALDTTLDDKLKSLSDADYSTPIANDNNKQTTLSSPPSPSTASSVDKPSITEDSSTIVPSPAAAAESAAESAAAASENEASTSVPLTPVSEVPEDSKSESLTSAIVEKGSRFYIKRRIIVGNVSKFIPPGNI
jgi:hypothetical protein